jgi:hypothetical protein
VTSGARETGAAASDAAAAGAAVTGGAVFGVVVVSGVVAVTDDVGVVPLSVSDREAGCFACVTEATRVPFISSAPTARTAQTCESLHFAMTAAPSSSETHVFKTET